MARKPKETPLVAGEVVHLFSGGDPVTVARVGTDECECVWMTPDGRIFRDMVPIAALRRRDAESALPPPPDGAPMFVVGIWRDNIEVNIICVCDSVDQADKLCTTRDHFIGPMVLNTPHHDPNAWPGLRFPRRVNE